MDRMERLKDLIQKNPHDAFPRYGLAMEYRNRDDHRQAVEIFEELLDAHPDYCAAYYHMGMSAAALGEEQRAGKIFRKGIEVATRKGDTHARDELEAALEGLDSEESP